MPSAHVGCKPESSHHLQDPSLLLRSSNVSDANSIADTVQHFEIHMSKVEKSQVFAISHIAVPVL